MLELADAMDLAKFSVVGIGGGGPYALATMHQAARRFPGRVRGVGLVASEGPYQAENRPEAVACDSLGVWGDSMKENPWAMLLMLRAFRILVFLRGDSTVASMRKSMARSESDARVLDQITNPELRRSLCVHVCSAPPTRAQC